MARMCKEHDTLHADISHDGVFLLLLLLFFFALRSPRLSRRCFLSSHVAVFIPRLHLPLCPLTLLASRKKTREQKKKKEEEEAKNSSAVCVWMSGETAVETCFLKATFTSSHSRNLFFVRVRCAV